MPDGRGAPCLRSGGNDGTLLERIKSLYFSHCSKRFWPRTNLPHGSVACESASPRSAPHLSCISVGLFNPALLPGLPDQAVSLPGIRRGAVLVTGSCQRGLLVFKLASRLGTCEPSPPKGTESRLHGRSSPHDRNQVQTRTSTAMARRGQRCSSRLLVLGERWRGQEVSSALDTLQQIENLRHLLLSARVVLGVLSGLDKRRGPLQRLER